MSSIAFNILSPEEAKKRAKANVAEWLRQKEIEKKKAKIAGRKEKEQAKPSFPAPATEPISRIDWKNLDLNNVETLVASEQGVSAWEAIERANKEGKIIIPNCVHDRMLVETEHWKKDDIKAGYAAWTGTGIIHEAPDKAFEDKVVYIWEADKIQYSISVTVPQHFKGKKDCALLVEHPDFGLIALGNNNYELRVANENTLHLLENFPRQTGELYVYDERFRIPVGDPLDVQQVDDTMRYLWRVAGSYCGLLARYCVGGGVRQQVVFADLRPSGGLGVHVVARSAAPK